MKQFDAAIAGGGLIGGSIALELARAGPRVGVFDRQEPGREASWAGAGIISAAPEKPGMIPAVPLCNARLALYPELAAIRAATSRPQSAFPPKAPTPTFVSRN